MDAARRSAQPAWKLQRDLDARWSGEPARSDVYQQIARHVHEPALAAPWSRLVEGDAAALDEVRTPEREPRPSHFQPAGPALDL
jgi:hypothetical protein